MVTGVIEAEFFGKTKKVRAELHNMTEGEKPDHVMWAENGSDLYGLMSKQLKDKKVAVVWRHDWLKAKEDLQ